MNSYKPEESGKITCLLCRHYCTLKEGQSGICGVNANTNGALDNRVYGHPVALNIDPIEKKPLYHFLPGSTAWSFGTVGCNFRCPFCQNWNMSQTHRVDTAMTVTPERMVGWAHEYGAASIAYTYNEPTVFYPYAKDIGLLAHARGLKNVWVSNGFESPEVIRDMAGWVDAINIDLKSWDRAYYTRTLKGDLEGVKETLRSLVATGIWVEVTTLLIEGENDQEEAIEAMAAFIADELGTHVPWHLSAFHPDYKMTDHLRTHRKTLERAAAIGTQAGLMYLYLGNVAVSGITYCPECGMELIERNGFAIVRQNLVDGHCPVCNRAIEGVWH